MEYSKQIGEMLIQAAKDGYSVAAAADLCEVPNNVLTKWIYKPTTKDTQSFSLLWKKTKAINFGERMRILRAIANKKNRDSLTAIKMIDALEVPENAKNEDGLEKLIEAIRNPVKGHNKEREDEE